MDKPWYQSKTKIGGGLLGIGAFWSSLDPGLISTVISSIGLGTTIWGVRDWPIVN